MPRVPTVAGPSVAEASLTGGFDRSNPQPIQNTQLAEAGRAMFEIGTQIQEIEDADALLREETVTKGKWLEWAAEAKQRKGQQAWGVAKEAASWWDKEASEGATRLSNSRQQRLFRRSVEALKAQSIGVFAGFEADERRRSVGESAQASIVGSINLAAANPQSAEVLQASKADIVKRTDLLARLNGWDGTIREAKQTEYLTNFHKQVIQALVQTNPGAAQAYFDANKGEIEGTQHAEVGDFARKATATRLGNITADAAWQEAGPKSDRDPVQLDVLETRVRKALGANDEATKTAIAAVRERAAAFKDARRERDDQLEGQVNQAILQGKSSREVREMSAFLALSPDSARKIVTFLENKEYTALQRGNAMLQREELSAQRRVERETMGAYLTYSNPDTLAGMTELQVMNLLPLLGNEHTKRLMEKRRDLAKPQQLADARMDEDTFNHIAREMKLPVDKTTKTENEKARLGELKYRVERVIESAQRRAGKNLTAAEKEDLIRREVARTVSVDTSWPISPWQDLKDVPVIALTPKDVAKVVIPAADRKQLADAMAIMYQRTGRAEYAPTEDNRKRFYLLRKTPAADLVVPQQR